MTRKPDARTFGQMSPWWQDKAGSARTVSSASGAVLMPSLSGRIPDYYIQKRAAEAATGRTLDNAEFERDHLKIPEGGGLSSSGTSVFDPVLCELVYRWFCPQGGVVLDPFAGGSVRGIVASRLGRRYVGVELRAEQVAANREQGAALCGDPAPVWHHGDSRHIRNIATDVEADLVFSCPPYADLERYSDDPADLSTMDYPAFRTVYAEIIAESCPLLRNDRFACFVVGDVRGKDGTYYGFPWHTVQAFEAAGLRLYNDAILITPAGSLPIRVGRQFDAARKLGKTHQNILVFVKGDARKATEAIGPVEFGDVPADDATPAPSIAGVEEL